MADFPNFFNAPPHPQNALNLFAGEWSTRLPNATGLTASTGPMRGCEDYRVTWFAPFVGGYAGKRILELGPLEGGHSLMLEHLGAREIVSIEANARAYLKCLIMKEVFGLSRVRYHLGDFVTFLHASSDRFAIGFACGVLYHLANPVELIQLLSLRCESVFVWTHYFDPAAVAEHPDLRQRFTSAPTATVVGGYAHLLHPKSYDEARAWNGFCGGGEPSAAWLSYNDLIGAFRHFGFRVAAEVREENPNGPALLLAVTRNSTP